MGELLSAVSVVAPVIEEGVKAVSSLMGGGESGGKQGEMQNGNKENERQGKEILALLGDIKF
jgi:hypothetical protein